VWTGGERKKTGLRLLTAQPSTPGLDCLQPSYSHWKSYKTDRTWTFTTLLSVCVRYSSGCYKRNPPKHTRPN